MALSGKEMETVQAPAQVKEEVSAQAVQQQQEIKEGNKMAKRIEETKTQVQQEVPAQQAVQQQTQGGFENLFTIEEGKEKQEQKPNNVNPADIFALYADVIRTKLNNETKTKLAAIHNSGDLGKLIVSDVDRAYATMNGGKSPLAIKSLREHLALASQAGFFMDLATGNTYWHTESEDAMHAACLFVRGIASILAKKGVIKASNLPYVEYPYWNINVSGLTAASYDEKFLTIKELIKLHSGFSFEDEYTDGHPNRSFELSKDDKGEYEITQTDTLRINVADSHAEEKKAKKKAKKKDKKKDKKAKAAAEQAKAAEQTKAAKATNDEWTWGDTLMTIGVAAAAGAAAYYGYKAFFGDDDAVSTVSDTASDVYNSSAAGFGRF